MSKQHDTGYKELFSYPELVQQLMEGFAPPEVSNILDYTTLKQHSGNYITPLFNEQIEDVVWSVQLKPQASKKPVTVYLYILLEFQSAIDKTMPLRMLHYCASFYHQLLKQKEIKLKDGLPPVFPIVLYNGIRRWTAAQHMQQLIQPVPEFLKKFQPQIHYYLVDEQRYSFDELKQINQPLSSAFALEKARTTQEITDSLMLLFQRAVQHPDAERVFRVLKRWSQRHLHHNQLDINLEHIADAEELSTMMTKYDYITQELRKQGRMEGIEEGMERGLQEGHMEGIKQAVLKLLQQGLLTEAQIAQALELPLTQVQSIKNQSQH